MGVTSRRRAKSIPFNHKLRSIMTQRNLTVRDTAKLAGVSPSVIQSWMSDAVPHDLEAVSRLADALNIGFKELILGDNEKKSHLVFTLAENDYFEARCTIHLSELTPKKKERAS